MWAAKKERYKKMFRPATFVGTAQWSHYVRGHSAVIALAGTRENVRSSLHRRNRTVRRDGEGCSKPPKLKISATLWEINPRSRYFANHKWRNKLRAYANAKSRRTVFSFSPRRRRVAVVLLFQAPSCVVARRSLFTLWKRWRRGAADATKNEHHRIP